MTTDPVDPADVGAGDVGDGGATDGGQAADRDDPAGPERRQLSELQVVAMAAVAWVGALVAQPLPLAVGAVAGAAALALRRPLLLIAAAGLLASGLGHRSAERFVPVDPAAVTELEVVLVDDPRPVEHGWRATVRLPDGRRVEAVAHGSAGVRLFVTRVGGRLLVDGALDTLDDTSWTRSRHLLGRLRMATAVPVAGPTGWRAVIESLRDRVVAGAEPLPEAARPLYLGLVVGEDRFQQPDQRARFAAAGLAHLLAVSGQNVAFALVLLRPVTGLLGHRGRFVATIVALVVIAVATRAEPSVLRATLTAGLAASASLTGDRQSGLRLLGLAVTALVLIDPFLTTSVGFQLSVAASAGILLLTPILTGRLRGPSFLVEPLAVTIAAQAAVTPILIGRFGPVSLGSVPANFLGGWAAGLVMMWGLTVGVVAGALGGWA
ncbi:MAG: ComEC/Rec2 family competence protein, partial [Acidimicrobiia bacterium]|nr:ComEC/Rec2 family competence protein [Acidimicrobiia bacterium]